MLWQKVLKAIENSSTKWRFQQILKQSKTRGFFSYHYVLAYEPNTAIYDIVFIVFVYEVFSGLDFPLIDLNKGI